MANLASGPVQMAAWINKTIATYRLTAEVVIVPLSGIDSNSDTIALLCAIKGFAAPSLGAAAASVGSLQFSSKRTVDEALRELSGGSISVLEMGAAIDSVVAQPVDGVTVEVKTPVGTLLIDKFVFAKKANLALDTKIDCQFTAFIKEVPNCRPGSREGAKSQLFVLVRGTGPTPGSCQDLASVPAELISKLDERAKHAFDTIAEFNFDSIYEGWQLLAMKGFDDVLGRLRSGYSYVLQKNSRVGLAFSY